MEEAMLNDISLRQVFIFSGLIILLILTPVMLSCGGGSGGGGGDGDDDDAEVTSIGPAGGEVEDDEGAKVVIPSGALSDTYEISVFSYTDNESLPDGWAPIPEMCGAIELEPEGLTFNIPVTITVPVPEQLDAGSKFPLLYWNDDTQVWEQTDFVATVADDGMSYSADITHFSGYGGGAIQNLIAGGSTEEFLNAFAAWFQNNVRKIGDKRERDNECFRVTGLDFDLSYEINGQKGQDFKRVGETSDYADAPLTMVDYTYDVTNGHGFSGYVIITTIIYYDCTEPDFTISADKTALEEGESTSVEAAISCAGKPLIAKDVTFDIKSGPGEINPGNTTTNSGGKASSTFTAGNDNAVVRAFYTSCELGDSTVMQTTVPIAVGKDNFSLAVTFSQSTNADGYTDYWDYSGSVSIYVTGDNGDGTKNVEGSNTFIIEGAGTADPDCTSTTAGTATYTLTGTLVTGNQSDQTLNLTQTVSYNSIKTLVCPDMPPILNDFPDGTATSSFEIPVEDGYTIDKTIPAPPITTHITYVLSVSG
jgi:hypothetical protein